MCPNLLECFLIPSISVGAVHNSKWTNEKSQQPTYGMCPRMKSHILSGIYQDSSTPFVEETGNDQHYHRNYCVLHSVLTPHWVRVGGYCGPSKPANPTPHCHHGVAFNGHWKWQYWAQNVRINPLRPIPPANDNTNQGVSKSQCQREENWKRTWNLMRRNWSLQIVSQQFLTFLNCLWFHPFFYNFSRCCLWVFTERVGWEECGRTGNNIYSRCIIIGWGSIVLRKDVEHHFYDQ